MHDTDIYNQPLSMFFLAGADRKRRRDRQQHGIDYVEKSYEFDDSGASDYPAETSDENLSIWLARRLPDIDSWVTRIRWAEDLEDVVHITKGEAANGKKCLLNMNNLRLHSGDQLKKDTVEFRQCRGTLDIIKSISYLNLFIHLTIYCHRKPEDDFYDLIDSQGKFHRPEIGTHSLLETIKCNKATKEFFKDQSEAAFSKSLMKKQQSMKGIVNAEPLAAIAYEALGQLECTDPLAVRHRIQAKQTHGGYRHFSEKYLRSASMLQIRVVDRLAAMKQMRLSNVPALMITRHHLVTNQASMQADTVK